MEKITQVGDDEECSHPNLKDQQFVLLLRVIQANGQPLPVEVFTSRAVVQMICEATGVMPKEVEILSDQEVVVEVEELPSIMDVSQGVQGLCWWGGQAIKIDGIVAVPDPLGRLVGEVNESKVIIEGQEMRALLDMGSQLSSILWTWVKRLNLEPKQLQSILQIEGSGGLEVPYLGYVEV